MLGLPCCFQFECSEHSEDLGNPQRWLPNHWKINNIVLCPPDVSAKGGSWWARAVSGIFAQKIQESGICRWAWFCSNTSCTLMHIMQASYPWIVFNWYPPGYVVLFWNGVGWILRGFEMFWNVSLACCFFSMTMERSHLTNATNVVALW